MPANKPSTAMTMPGTMPGNPAFPLEKVDLPEVREAFADSIENVVFDGQTLRIEFCVTRLEQSKAGPRAKRYTGCRMVMTPAAAMELMNQMQLLRAQLEKSGVIKPAAAPGDR